MSRVSTLTRVAASGLAVAGLALGTQLAASVGAGGRATTPAPGSLAAAAALPPAQAIAAREAVDAKGKVDGSSGVRRSAAGVNQGKAALGVGRGPASAKVDPRAMTSAATRTGACVPGYGRGGQCLPNAPGSMLDHDGMSVVNGAWTCAWVRQRLPQGIPVVKTPASIALGKRMVTPPVRPGVDPIGLDSTTDGIACGPGDR